MLYLKMGFYLLSTHIIKFLIHKYQLFYHKFIHLLTKVEYIIMCHIFI